MIEITAPDDWHVHLRDGDDLKAVLPWTSEVFARAVVMPNLQPPVSSVASAQAYRGRILAALPRGSKFQPLMTFYLGDSASPKELESGIASGLFIGAKLYPAHATTNAEAGVTKIENIFPLLEVLQDTGRPLLVHAEDASPNVDVFDREKVFLENILGPTIKKFPRLKVVVEHITTKEAVEFVRRFEGRVAATITAHHLLINRNAMFMGGFRPHFYCLPVAKREEHRLALIDAATSGSSQFFLGTDSAPHGIRKKETACGCAGIFSAPGALLHYAEVFLSRTTKEVFEAFTSLNGPRFYGLPVNQHKIKLQKVPWIVPKTVEIKDDVVKVFRGGETLPWSLG
jgi:dihydroorotase